MHALVVYDSQFGNTERIAAAIADTLRTTGEVRLAHVEPAHPLDLEGVDLLILGCPTQGWAPTVAMQALTGGHYATGASWAGRRLLRHALPEAALDHWVGCAQIGGQLPTHGHHVAGTAGELLRGT